MPALIYGRQRVVRFCKTVCEAEEVLQNKPCV